MIGLVYVKTNKQIFARIENVQSITEKDIIGQYGGVAIDVSITDFCIVETSDLQVGDTLGDFTDVRHLLPESDAQKISRLEAEKASLQEKLGQLNTDFVAFTDFYFEKNPTQA